ncbi:nucleobase:cation symporter-2 family protein [Lysinibacillus endophyticus]|uniref:Purine permease n=1 Tax=Ureibacillus endophyticus TaxID=1978490 RepID=A0A494Z8K4_9BACL|nr:nucleobase:cation symporter-2 family protein [Lysinibacillus endophyticus]MCP1143320.1 purine permease [Lysinibacillus endophyticus]RKQ18927.1 purine permease [Lysinibacillus endophyticus]
MNNAKATTLGIQHLLAMYAGAILVPLIIGGALGFDSSQMTYLVAIDIMMCGIATLLQVMRGKAFGIGLPVVLGCTFTAVFPIIAIGTDKGIGAIYGAVIASGIIVVLISGFFGKLVKFFPPVVTGSVVTIIGISLIPVAINNMGGGQGAEDFGSASNIALAMTTLVIILLIYRFTTGFTRAISILLGLVISTVIAAFMGKVDFSPVTDASWFHMVQPFYFGMPTFDIGAIITMTLVAMVSLVESSGVYFALSDITKQKLESKDLARGYRSEGLASIIGGIFNAFPYTTFSQNVGLLKMTGVKERKVIFITGIMLVALGFLPKVAALTTIIPTAVLGGAMLAMFGMVVTQGITMLAPEISLSPENAMVAAIAVGLGAGVVFVPDIFAVLPEGISILTSNGIVCGSVTAIVLNIVFNMIGSKKVDPMYTEAKEAVDVAKVAEVK